MSGRPQTLRQARSAPGLRRPLALLAAYAVLIGHLLAAADALLVGHQTCPAHGEVVHARADGTPVSPAPASVSIGATDREAPSCADDRCCVTLAERREGPLPPDETADDVLFPRAQPCSPVADAYAVPPPVPLLSLAPKSSPPSDAA